MTREKQTAGRVTSSAATIVKLAVNGAFAREAADASSRALTDAGYATAVQPAGDIVSQAPLIDQHETGATIGVVVADRDDPVIAELTAMWHSAGIPSLAVVQEHPDVRIGPLNVPGTDLCATCFTSRVHQHEPIPPPRGEEPEEPADRGPATSMDGFPSYLIALVVALLVDRLGVLGVLGDEAAKPRNEVTVVNTATLVIRTHPVIPVNLCPQCSDDKPIGVLGGGDPMLPALSGVPR